MMKFSKVWLASLILASCFLQAGVPKWYTAQKSNETAFIGYGSGASLKEAKGHALSDISNQIKVQVQNKLKMQQSETSKSINGKEKFSSVSSASEDTELTSNNNLAFITYTKSDDSKGVFYVEARLDKLAYKDYLDKKIASLLSKVVPLVCAPFLSFKEAATNAKIYAEVSPLVDNLALLGGLASSMQDAYDTLGSELAKQDGKASVKLSFNLEGLEGSLKLKSMVKKAAYKMTHKLLRVDERSSYTMEITSMVEDDTLMVSIAYKNCSNEEIYEDTFTLPVNTWADRIYGLMYKSVKKYLGTI